MLSKYDLNNAKLEKFWGVRQIFFSAGFATPFAGCYLISRNFKLLQLEKRSKYLLLVGILLNFLLLPISSIIAIKLLPNIPHFILPLAFALLVQEYAKYTQADGLHQLKNIGRTRYSFMSWLWVNIILLILGSGLMAIGFFLIWGLAKLCQIPI